MHSMLAAEMPVAGSRAGEGQRGRAYYAALAAVIVLGVLLVVGLVALVFGFMRQDRILRAGSAGSPAGAAPAVVELAPGARIVSVKTTADRLILQLATPKGGEVEVLDLSTGKLLFRAKAAR